MTCVSCLHSSLDGRFCHNWQRPTETGNACRQYVHTSTELAWLHAEVRRETTPRRKPNKEK